jgi:hypothetical protein
MRRIPLGGSIGHRLKDLLYEPEKMEKFPDIYIAIYIYYESEQDPQSVLHPGRP